jgi:hypothetical protein
MFGSERIIVDMSKEILGDKLRADNVLFREMPFSLLCSCFSS